MVNTHIQVMLLHGHYKKTRIELANTNLLV